MKKFNKVLTMEIEVDSIAKKMLDLFAGSDYQHSEILVEAVIGTAVEKGTMSYIYNALNGYNNEIDFNVNDVVTCTETHYGYVAEAVSEPIAGSPAVKWTRKEIQIGKCKVIEINLYTSNKLKVEFEQRNSQGALETNISWVNHKKCAGTAEPVVQA